MVLPEYSAEKAVADATGKNAQKGTGMRFTKKLADAAWEKGSVENANRHIRRFFPKGTNFLRVTAAEVAAMRDFINSIPRQATLKGKRS